MVGVLSGPYQPPTVLGSFDESETPQQRFTAMIEQLKAMPQREMPVTHRFQPGVYLREIFMPADTWVIGHIHRHAHYNMIVAGRAVVQMEGELLHVKAGDVIFSGPGVQKVLYIEEDCRWVTIHANPSNCLDVATLEEEIVVLPDDVMAAKGALTLDQFRLSLSRTLTENKQ